MIHFRIRYCLKPLDNLPTIFTKDLFAKDLDEAKAELSRQIGSGNIIILEIIPVETL